MKFTLVFLLAWITEPHAQFTSPGFMMASIT